MLAATINMMTIWNRFTFVMCLRKNEFILFLNVDDCFSSSSQRLVWLTEMWPFCCHIVMRQRWKRMWYWSTYRASHVFMRVKVACIIHNLLSPRAMRSWTHKNLADKSFIRHARSKKQYSKKHKDTCKYAKPPLRAFLQRKKSHVKVYVTASLIVTKFRTGRLEIIERLSLNVMWSRVLGLLLFITAFLKNGKLGLQSTVHGIRQNVKKSEDDSEIIYNLQALIIWY